LASEGLPYLLDQYRLKVADGEWERRANEFPLGDGVVDFGLDTPDARKIANSGGGPAD